MTSKERVTVALMHRESDRLPRFIWMGDDLGSQQNMCAVLISNNF